MTLTNLAELTQHFTENPDGFLVGQAHVTVTHHPPGILEIDSDDHVTDYGDQEIVLFSIGRIPNDHNLQEYVNVVALSGQRVLKSVQQSKDRVTAFSTDKHVSRFSSPAEHLIKTDTLQASTPGVRDLIEIMRWRDKTLTENGLRPVNTAEVFQAAKNAASSEFFTSLFAGSSVPDRNHLLEGMKLLQDQLNALPSPEDEPLKLDDLVEFRDGRRGKIVELFPVDDKIVVLSPFGKTVVVPYGDVTKVQ